MSQAILSIDATVSPARLVVANVDDGKIAVVESHKVDVGNLFERSTWNDLTKNDLTNSNQAEQEKPESESASSSENGASQAKSNGVWQHAESDSLRQLIESIEAPWHTAILIIPGSNYLSLNLQLPFDSPKQISKILDLEVQDVVPFDVSDFLLDYSLIAAHNSGAFDFHVGMIPKSEISHVLQACNFSGFDPQLISTSAGILSAVFHLGPDYFCDNCAIIWADHPNYSIAIAKDRVVQSARSLPYDRNDSDDLEQLKQMLLREIKLSILAIESKRKFTVDKIYLFGSSFAEGQLQSTLGRAVEKVTSSELVSNDKESNSLASLASIFGHDLHLIRGPKSSTTNFRCGEYSYRPRLKELFSGLRALVPYFAALLITLLATLFGIYQIRVGHMENLRTRIQETIKEAIPDLNPRPGLELDAISKHMESMEDRMKGLGSLSSLSPLDALLEISQDLPTKGTEIEVHSLTIRESKLNIKGTAPDYTALDKLKGALKRKKTTYCSVEQKDSTAFGRSGKRGFELIIRLCD